MQHGRARAELYRLKAGLGETPASDGGWEVDVELAEAELDSLCTREGIPRPLTAAPCFAGSGFLHSRRAAAPSAT